MSDPFMESRLPSRLALFDIDGTLVDSQAMIVSVMQACLQAHGLPIPAPESVHQVIGLSLEKAIGVVADKPAEECEAMADWYRHFFRQKVDEGYAEPLFPGAADLVRGLVDRNWLIGAATGKVRRGLDRVLANHQLDHLFVTKQTADVAASKPDPEMIYRAMKETGVKADQLVMIGDTAWDIAMAKNAGVKAIGVSWGCHPVDGLVDAGADQIVDSFDALAQALHTLA